LLAEHGAQAAPRTARGSDYSIVTERLEAAGQRERQVSPWQAIAIFLTFTICLDAPFWVLVNATETVNAAYIFGMMWMPAIAAAKPRRRSASAGRRTGW
jgi:hypothetical protein